MKFNLINKLLFWIFLFFLVDSIVFQIVSNWKLYSIPFNHQAISKVYNHSQFAPKPEDRRVIIEDYDLFAYSGYLYLKGQTPADIQIEHPPLAKYFFGLSILLFSNPNVIQIFFGIGTLFLIFLISNRILRNKTLALVPPFLFSFDGIFKEQLALSYLDLPHLFFICLALFFYFKAEKTRNYYYLAVIFLGAVIMTKYMGFAIIPLLLVYTFVKRKKDFNFFLLLTSIAIPSIYLANYISLFFKDNILSNFINLHLAIFHLLKFAIEFLKSKIIKI